MGTISLEQAYNRSLDDEKFLIQQFENPDERQHYLLSLIGVNEYFFLYKFFVENDFLASKKYLFRISQVNTYYADKLGGDIYEALNTFVFPVLSDSSEQIQHYLKYSETPAHLAFNTFFGKSIQAVLNGNDKALEQNIQGLDQVSKSGWQKNYSGVVDGFTGLLEKNSNRIKSGISKLLALHNKQNHASIAKQYINFEATAIAKLAWKIGLEVKIDNPLIPLDLLPVRELSDYEGYDFL